MFLTLGTFRSILSNMKLSDYLVSSCVEESVFAAQLGVSKKAVRHWVRGDRTPRQGQMQKIVLATKGAVRPNDFLPMEAAQ